MVVAISGSMYSPNPTDLPARPVSPRENDQAPETALSLAGSLARTGRLLEAAEVLRTACERTPAEPLLFLQLGRVLLSMRVYDEAVRCFERVAALTRKDLTDAVGVGRQPQVFLEAATHLATLYRGKGERLLALNYLYDAVFLSDDPEIRRQFADCVSEIPFADAQPALKPLLVRALAENWGEPAALIRFSGRQLLLQPEFMGAARSLAARTDVVSWEDPAITIVSRDALLCAMLSAGIVAQPLLERTLTVVRRALLDACVTLDATTADADQQLVPFAAALAIQCFITDYAYATVPDETATLARLESEVAGAAAGGLPLAPLTLAALASYRPLHRLECASALAERPWSETLEPLIHAQLRAPRRESTLRSKIVRMTPIADAVSTRVRAQYEESPFPRWITTAIGTRRLSLGQWLRGMFPHLPPALPRYRNPATPLSILVAGCGTGQEPVRAATCFASCEVLAVDLSLASLAHAVRKSEELGLKNIACAQADILELDGIGRQFDIVECVGVLHHLGDPLAGWRVLSRLTRPGGYMLLGLYSERGRSDLDPARTFITEGGYGSEPDDLRRFRADVLTLAEDDPVRRIASTRDDFYNLSMLRDMLFHVQEHRFTIAGIRAALAELELDFGGFVAAPEINVGYRQRFGQGTDPASLENWEAFESERPDTFSDMYQFLALRRPG